MIDNGGNQAIQQDRRTPLKAASGIPQSRYDTFFQALLPDKPAFLSLDSKLSHTYMPQSLQPNYPLLLSELYIEDMNMDDIHEHCVSAGKKVMVTVEEARNMESATREQSSSNMWHSFRTGRITAS